MMIKVIAAAPKISLVIKSNVFDVFFMSLFSFDVFLAAGAALVSHAVFLPCC